MRIGALAALAVGGAAASAGGIGWAIARQLTAPLSGRAFDLKVLGVVSHKGQEAIVLDRTARTTAAGRYNLWLEDGGWVHLGEVVHEDAATVTRLVEGETPARMRAGQAAAWSGIYYRDPTDLGVVAVDIPIETPAGHTPAWLIEPAAGAGDRWAIHIHGLGSPRAGTLRGVEVAAAAGFTSLVVSYRNDAEGPRVGSGRSALGAVETNDVLPALRYAIAHGARQLVLFGWSMGAAIALQAAAELEFREVLRGLVLESPVLDWQATINANCARAHLPSWFGVLTRPWLLIPVLSRMIGLEVTVPLGRFDWQSRADRLWLPMLILHGVDDTSTPYDLSRRLADRRPDLVALETFSADHTMCWNSDPERWRRATLNWLASQVGPAV